ncbi:MAG: HlyD family efflux transporter periplasmic adaptor subunit [Oscillatoriales cyanobacterium RM2_1_1]|nr:HlyD family efflux transporter periplasmic adaptor subunit [Oscillatoriales cyanobacterium SM2_3_0]NJO47549.1 HlyD family efflux transporter periplasmic adaptor subunit [Oscillatoriales cyanobacterium RM2_1_1]
MPVTSNSSEVLPLKQPFKLKPLPSPIPSQAQAERWSASLQAVLDQPPASLPLRVMLGGILFTATFITWAYLGTMNEISRAQGELIPQNDTYEIHPTEMGKISSIAIQEGNWVKPGQVIVELDSQLALNEVNRLQQRLSALRIELSQQQGLLGQLQSEAQTRRAIAQAQIEAQEASIHQVKTRMAGNQELLRRLQTEMQASQARLQTLEPLSGQVDNLLQQLQTDKAAAQERVDRLQPLVEEGALSKDLLYQAEQSMRDRQQAIVQAQLAQENSTREQIFQAEQQLRDRLRSQTQYQEELKQFQAEADRLAVELTQKQAEAKNDQLEAQQKVQQIELEVTRLQSELTETQNLIEAAQTRLENRFLYAPIGGLVSSLNVKNPGEVVQPGQTIAEIIPANTPLVLSAKLPSQEAGFVEAGMPVKIKFDAYSYQEYGAIEGTIQSISPDTKPQPGAASNPNTQPVYYLDIRLDKDYIMEDGKMVKFKPGQTAKVDIVTRNRRIIDIFLDPIRQLNEGGGSR